MPGLVIGNPGQTPMPPQDDGVLADATVFRSSAHCQALGQRLGIGLPERALSQSSHRGIRQRIAGFAARLATIPARYGSGRGGDKAVRLGCWRGTQHLELGLDGRKVGAEQVVQQADLGGLQSLSREVMEVVLCDDRHYLRPFDQMDEVDREKLNPQGFNAQAFVQILRFGEV